MAKNRDNDDTILGGVIDQLSQITKAGRDVAADFVETVSPDAAGFIRPTRKVKSSSGGAREIRISSPSTRKAASKRSSAKKAVASSRKRSPAKGKAGAKSTKRSGRASSMSK